MIRAYEPIGFPLIRPARKTFISEGGPTFKGGVGWPAMNENAWANWGAKKPTEKTPFRAETKTCQILGKTALLLWL